MKLLISTDTDPYKNLAAEALLVETQTADEPVLFLWQSHDTVVIGKNQNPWRECRLETMHAEGVKLARRISGGGAVYHDGGNLNYSFVTQRDLYRSHKVYEIVLGALRQLGIKAEREGKSSLSVDGKKISGNAYCYKKHGAMHHGTFLVSTDLEKLKRVLKKEDPKISTRAIASIPAEVGNLLEVQPKISLDRLKAALIESFLDAFGEPDVLFWDDLDLVERTETMQSWDWLYGRTPPFEFFYKEKNTECRVEVEKGMVRTVNNLEITPLGFDVYREKNDVS